MRRWKEGRKVRYEEIKINREITEVVLTKEIRNLTK